MTCTHRWTVGMCGSLLIAFLSGCGLSKPFPDKALFAIDPGSPERTVAQISPLTLQVSRVRVAPPSDAQTFLYKLSGLRYETDYYNGFIAAPGQLLTAGLVGWVKQSGLFGVVVGSGSGLAHQFVLEGNVTELCGDYSDAKKPKAAIAASFFLIDDRTVDGRVLFQKTYHAVAPLSGTGPEALAKAMNEAYRHILQELTNDLSQVNCGTPQTRPTALGEPSTQPAKTGS
jgi:cholesterol transport system auxiliary component